LTAAAGWAFPNVMQRQQQQLLVPLSHQRRAVSRYWDQGLTMYQPAHQLLPTPLFPEVSSSQSSQPRDCRHAERRLLLLPGEMYQPFTRDAAASGRGWPDSVVGEGIQLADIMAQQPSPSPSPSPSLHSTSSALSPPPPQPPPPSQVMRPVARRPPPSAARGRIKVKRARDASSSRHAVVGQLQRTAAEPSAFSKCFRTSADDGGTTGSWNADGAEQQQLQPRNGAAVAEALRPSRRRRRRGQHAAQQQARPPTAALHQLTAGHLNESSFDDLRDQAHHRRLVTPSPSLHVPLKPPPPPTTTTMMLGPHQHQPPPAPRTTDSSTHSIALAMLQMGQTRMTTVET
jgi:hypothetical protein